MKKRRHRRTIETGDKRHPINIKCKTIRKNTGKLFAEDGSKTKTWKFRFSSLCQTQLKASAKEKDSPSSHRTDENRRTKHLRVNYCVECFPFVSFQQVADTEESTLIQNRTSGA